MHRMFTLSPEGKRVYTLKKVVDGVVAQSAHPARFSPDDKMSRQRVTLKKRCVERRGPLSSSSAPVPRPYNTEYPAFPTSPAHLHAAPLSLSSLSLSRRFDLIPVKASTYSQ